MSIQTKSVFSKPTLIGFIAPIIWASYAVVAVTLKQIPKFQVLSLVFLSCYLVLSLLKVKTKKFNEIPKFLLFAGFLGICINPLCYLCAFRYAPPAHADLINYLWPIIILFGSMMLPNEKFCIKGIIAGLVAFSGIAFLMISDGISSVKTSYFVGYGFALSAAITWSTFNLSLKYYQISIKSLLKPFCMLGFIMFSALHFTYESFLMPNSLQLAGIIFGGAGSICVAYLCWDIGIRKGHTSLLTLSSYSIPILSIALLVLFGYVDYSNNLLVATSFVTAAGTMSAVGH